MFADPDPRTERLGRKLNPENTAASISKQAWPLNQRHTSLADKMEDLRAPRARKKKAKSAHDPNDQRPTIRLEAGNIERIVDEAEVALIKADRGLYQRDNRIVDIKVWEGR